LPGEEHNSSGGGERRLVTALCYDLVGSTNLLMQSDVEDFDELIQDFQGRARHAVVSRGASLRETGDGGVALFPIEIDARDAASVAINAGLEIVEACARVGRERDRADVHVRVGVATSMGLVRDRPEKPSPDNVTAVALAMASRLQTIAEPDTVVVSQQTRMLAGRSHAFNFRGVRRIKGMAEPERIWRALSHRVEVGRFHAFGRLSTPTVGREVELKAISERWRAAAAGKGNVLLIEGEAGMGKSRLLHEIRRLTRRERRRMLLLQCWPSGSYSTLHPLRQSFPGAEVERAGRLTASAVAELFKHHGVDDPDVVDVFAFLLGADGVTDRMLQATPPELEERISRALRGGLKLLCADGPVVLAVEDIHWIDPTSGRLLSELAAFIDNYPALLVLTARPEGVAN
jgi:class 3 adenylate cyclase